MAVELEDLTDRLRGFVADLQGVSEEQITIGPDSDLRNDLEIDSLSSIELAINLDEWYSTQLEDADVFEATTVSDLLQVIRTATS